MKTFDYVTYRRNYNKLKYQNLKIQFDREKEKDVIDYLSSIPHKKQFIVKLIRKYMEENK